MVARTVPLLESLRKASLAIPKRFVQVDKFFLHLFYFFIKEHDINVDKDSALEKDLKSVGSRNKQTFFVSHWLMLKEFEFLYVIKPRS